MGHFLNFKGALLVTHFLLIHFNVCLLYFCHFYPLVCTSSSVLLSILPTCLYVIFVYFVHVYRCVPVLVPILPTCPLSILCICPYVLFVYCAHVYRRVSLCPFCPLSFVHVSILYISLSFPIVFVYI